jgi:hypothetical protein
MANMEALGAAQQVYKQQVAVQYQQRFPRVAVGTGMVLLVSHGNAPQKRYALACELFVGDVRTVVHDWLQGDMLDSLCVPLTT